MSLRNKVVIISGGSRGIGRACVMKMAKEGAKVIFTYKENAAAAAETIDKCKKYKGTVESYKVDICEMEQVKNMVKKVIGTHKTIDIIVNNAGIRRDKTLPFLTVEDWDTVIDTNLTGVYNLTKVCIHYLLKKKSGRVVNVSSLSGMTGIIGQTNYSSSKAGLIGFTKALAKEVAPYNISVNAIVPGGIETDMTDSLNRDQLDNLMRDVPMNRLGKPDEIAQVISFLVDDKKCPSFLTGSTINIDGGV